MNNVISEMALVRRVRGRRRERTTWVLIEESFFVSIIFQLNHQCGCDSDIVNLLTPESWLKNHSSSKLVFNEIINVIVTSEIVMQSKVWEDDFPWRCCESQIVTQRWCLSFFFNQIESQIATKKSVTKLASDGWAKWGGREGCTS